MVMSRREALVALWGAAVLRGGRAAVGPGAGSMGEPTGPPLELTIGLGENRRFRDEVAAALLHVERLLGPRLVLPLTPDSMIDPRSARRAIVHALVMVDGQARGVFSNYVPGLDRPTSLGSISKAIGVLALAEHRPDLLRDAAGWCSQRAFGFRDADGYEGGRCNSPRTRRFNARDATAASKNLAMLWALRQLDQSMLRAQLRAAGLDPVPAQLPAVMLSMGHLELSALQAVEFFHAMATGRALRAAIVSGAAAPASGLAHWAARVVRLPGRAVLVHRVMSSPLRGTARHLTSELSRTSSLVIKTGTATNAPPARQDVGKVLAASFGIGTGGTATVLAAVLSPRPSSLPLGSSLPTAGFGPLHRVLINFAKEQLK